MFVFVCVCENNNDGDDNDHDNDDDDDDGDEENLSDDEPAKEIKLDQLSGRENHWRKKWESERERERDLVEQNDMILMLCVCVRER